MLYYTNPKEYEFFELNRYNNENIPTWNDIEFLIKRKELENIRKLIQNKKEQIPERVWNKIVNLFQFKDNKNEIKTLRDMVISKNPDIAQFMQNGEIKSFEQAMYNGKSLLESTKNINIETYSSMYEFFKRGEHIGNCGRTSRFMGVMFENPEFHTGKNLALLGTKNCHNGVHAWLETNINGEKCLVDTSMMLVIPTYLKEKCGYEDTQRPYFKDELMPEDMYFNHYEELTKRSTKGKLSYASYRENIMKIEKQKCEEFLR